MWHTHTQTCAHAHTCMERSVYTNTTPGTRLVLALDDPGHDARAWGRARVCGRGGPRSGGVAAAPGPAGVWGTRTGRRGQPSPSTGSWAPGGRKGKPAPPVLVGPAVPGPLSWGGAGSGLQKLRLDPVSCRPRSRGTGSRLALSKGHLIPALGPGGGLLSGAVGPGVSAGQSALALARGLSWDYPPPGRRGILGARGHATPSSRRYPDTAAWPFCRRNLSAAWSGGCGLGHSSWGGTVHSALALGNVRPGCLWCPCPAPAPPPPPPGKQPGEQRLASQSQRLVAGIVNRRGWGRGGGQTGRLRAPGAACKLQVVGASGSLGGGARRAPHIPLQMCGGSGTHRASGPLVPRPLSTTHSCPRQWIRVHPTVLGPDPDPPRVCGSQRGLEEMWARAGRLQPWPDARRTEGRRGRSRGRLCLTGSE